MNKNTNKRDVPTTPRFVSLQWPGSIPGRYELTDLRQDFQDWKMKEENIWINTVSSPHPPATQVGEELIRLKSSAPNKVQKSRLCTLYSVHIEKG